MPSTLEDFCDFMTKAENLVRVRRNGYVEISLTNYEIASSMAAKVGVDFYDWLRTYYGDCEVYEGA
jgi:hypothetical protein